MNQFETILNQKFYLTLKLNKNTLTINEPSRLNGTYVLIIYILLKERLIEFAQMNSLNLLTK